MSNNWKFPFYSSRSAAETQALADVTAASIPTVEFVEKSTDNAVGNVSFTVPASSPYRVEIPVLIDQAASTVTVGGNARTLVRGTAPGAGQVAVQGHWLTFNSADASGAAVLTNWAPYGTVVSAGMMHYLLGLIRSVLALVAGGDRVVVPLQWAGDASSTGSGTARTIKLPLDSGTWTIAGVSATCEGQAGGGSASTFLVGTAYSATPTNYWTITLADGASSAATVTTATNGSVARTSGQDIVVWQTVAGNHRFPTIYITLRRTA